MSFVKAQMVIVDRLAGIVKEVIRLDISLSVNSIIVVTFPINSVIRYFFAVIIEIEGNRIK